MVAPPSTAQQKPVFNYAAAARKSSAPSTAPSSAAPSPPASGASTPITVNGGVAPGAQPQHARKGSVMIGGDVQHSRASSINFGSISDPAAQLSSSPAANPMAGSHLADGKARTFGSLPADVKAAPATNGGIVSAKSPSSEQPPAAAPPAPAAPTAAKKKAFNPHAFFSGGGAAPAASAAPSTSPSPAAASSSAPSPAPSTSAAPPPQNTAAPAPSAPRRDSASGPAAAAETTSPRLSAPGPSFVPFTPGAGSAFRPGQPAFQPRSPSLQHNAPVAPAGPAGAGYARPPPPPQAQGRPPVSPQHQPHAPLQPPPPGPYGQPQWAAYPPAYYDPNTGYYMQPQWQAPAYQPMPPTSPSASHVPLPAGGPRPPATSPPSAPSTPRTSAATPSRPTFTPSASAAAFSPSSPALSGAAQPFAMPARKSAVIKISTASGEAVDLEKFRHARTASNATSSDAPGSPAAKSQEPIVKIPPKPVVIRMESEEAKARRLAEDAEKKRLKEVEEKEAAERKQREERRKKEEEEKALADKEAEEKRKRDGEEERARKEKEAKEAERKAKEELEKAQEAARAAAKKEAVEKDRKEREEKEQAEREEKEKADREAQAARFAKEEAVLLAEEKVKTDGAAPVAAVKDAAQEIAADTSARQADAKLIPSEAPSAVASPALSSLPSLPTSNVGTPSPGSPVPINGLPKRPALGTLDLSASAMAPRPGSSAALGSARILENLNDVSYPGDIKSPKPELNEQAQPGKFRYDREFLMQFMGVCTDKPESLPPLDAIGLEPDQNAGNFGSSGRGPRGGRGGAGSMPPPRVPVGGAFGAKVGAGGAFGQFSTDGARTSSAERFARAAAAGGIGNFGAAGTPISRTPSQGSRLPGVSPSPRDGGRGGRERSQRGRSRQDGGAKGGMSNTPLADQMGEIAPLEATANRWTPGSIARGPSAKVDMDSPEMVDRKVKSLLNKLTVEKFDSISDQIVDWANRSENETDGRTLRQVIRLVFEKATDEAVWSEMYARLCRKLLERLSDKITDESQGKTADGKPVVGGLLFRKYLLTRCQEDFERGWAQKDAAAAAAADKAADDKAKKEANEKADAEAAESGKERKAEAEVLSDEYYLAQKAKRRGLGLVRFIGELFKLQMLTSRIMHVCIKRLLSVRDGQDIEEEEIESLCKLLTTVGSILEVPQAKGHMDAYFARMKDICDNPKTNSRMRFMLLDVIELRAGKWVPRHKDAGPKSIAQIHEDAAKAKEQASAELQRGSSGRGHARNEMSRGSSRRGQSRSDFGVPPAPGAAPDGWNTVGPGAQQRPQLAGNLSNFGQIGANKPANAPMSFGPTSVFSKKGKEKSPAVSRTNSSANMFSILSAAESGAAAEQAVAQAVAQAAAAAGTGAAEGAPPAAEPVRKKLVLLPKGSTKPEGEKEGGEGEAPEAAATPSTAPAGISDDQAKRMVKTAVSEFFSLKKVEEGVESFKELPVDRRTALVEALTNEAINKKKEEIDVTALLFSAAAEQSLVTAGQFKEALGLTVEIIDDISIDVPQAYPFVAALLQGAKLERAAVEELADKIMVEGDPLVKPKDKLLKNFDEA